MFGVLTSLTKAVVGAVVEVPVSVVADVITLGGTLSDKGDSYTTDSLGRVLDNLKDAAVPDK